MRALPILSALALTLSALAACSAQPEGSPPHPTGDAGSTSSGAGAGGANTGFGGAPATAGASPGFGGAPAGAGSLGFGGAPPAAGGATGAAGGTVIGGSCTSTTAGTGIDGMVDDFEKHPASALIPASDGRVGGWWISIGSTGKVTTPTLPPAGGGPMPVTGGMGGGMALHFAGSDTDAVKGWGADASVALSGTGNCYDASIYTGGIKLSLMGKGSVYLSVITAQDKAAMATSGNQRKEIMISSTWMDYTIPWAQLVTGWGNPIPLDPKSIVALDIAPSASSAVDFDIWIDNVQFVK